MGVEGLAGVILDADAVRVGGPLVGGSHGGGVHDDNVVQVDILHRGFVVTLVLNLIHQLLAHEQTGNPLGCTGLQQGHGQHVTGSGGGAVEHQVHHQRQTDHQQNDDGEQQQEEAADDAAQKAAGFTLLFLTHFGYLVVLFCDAKTQRCWIV